MKRILFSLLCCLVTVGAMAVETTDYIKLSTATVNPGGNEVCITVSLVGSENYYSGYNMDIHLPEGMELNYYNNAPDVSIVKSGGILPYEESRDEITYFHTLSCSYGVVGDRILRVAVVSTQNKAFTATSGNLFKMYVKASSFAKPGAAQITIDGVALKVAGGSEYDPTSRVDENITVSTDATATMTVSSTNKWSTCILPFDAALPEGVKAYTCSETGVTDSKSVLKLVSASSIEAYTPYILYSESGYSGTLTGTVDAGKYPASGYVTKGFLNGAIVAQQITTGYVLQNLDKGVKFYNCNGSTFSIPAGKCWVTVPNGGEAKAFGFEIEDVTGISNVLANIKVADNVVYNLNGQKVSSTYRGVLVKKGRKFINK